MTLQDGKYPPVDDRAMIQEHAIDLLRYLEQLVYLYSEGTNAEMMISVKAAKKLIRKVKGY